MNRRKFTTTLVTGAAGGAAGLLIPWGLGPRSKASLGLTEAEAGGVFQPWTDYWLRSALWIDEDQDWGDDPIQQIRADDATTPWSWRIHQYPGEAPHTEVLLSESGHPFGPWTVEPGRWHAFTWRVRFSADDDGVIEAWRNERKILSLEGPNLESNHSVLTLEHGENKAVHLSRPEWRVS